MITNIECFIIFFNLSITAYINKHFIYECMRQYVVVTIARCGSKPKVLNACSSIDTCDICLLQI